MIIDEETHGRVHVLAVSGRLDTSTSDGHAQRMEVLLPDASDVNPGARPR